jgi:hypothetical protein
LHKNESKVSKKRKVDNEYRVFQQEWTSKCFFIEVSGKAVCLVCKESTAVLKDYNLSRHFQAKHAEKYRNIYSEQRTSASKLHSANDGIARASYVLSHKIAKHSKPFAEGKFIKECLMVCAAIFCPDKKELFENVSL